MRLRHFFITNNIYSSEESVCTRENGLGVEFGRAFAQKIEAQSSSFLPLLQSFFLVFSSPSFKVQSLRTLVTFVYVYPACGYRGWFILYLKKNCTKTTPKGPHQYLCSPLDRIEELGSVIRARQKLQLACLQGRIIRECYNYKVKTLV